MRKIMSTARAAQELRIHKSSLVFWRVNGKYPELEWTRYGIGFKRVGYYKDKIDEFKAKYKIDEYAEIYGIKEKN